MNTGRRLSRKQVIQSRHEKEASLLASIKQSEGKQLESYIKNRSLELDSEISRLSQKLQSRPEAQGSPLLAKINQSINLKVKGEGLSSRSASQSPSREGGSLSPVENGLSENDDSGFHMGRITSPIDPLDTVLHRIKYKLAEVQMSKEEFKEWLLPPDLILPGETAISIHELTDVLETELLMPVSKADQLLLLEAYGTDTGDIDVKALLQDAGLWVADRARRSDGPDMAPHRNSDNIQQDPTFVGKSTTAFNVLPTNIDESDAVIGSPMRTIGELDDLHNLVMEDEDRASEQQNALPEEKSDKPDITNPTDAVAVIDPTDNSKLHEENKKLRDELKAFDSEFFEQLEDLKFRYSRLQEIAGDVPLKDAATASSRGAVDDTTFVPRHSSTTSPNKGKLPLDRLAWSARNSMRAIDRARYDSPLVSHPHRDGSPIREGDNVTWPPIVRSPMYVAGRDPLGTVASSSFNSSASTPFPSFASSPHTSLEAFGALGTRAGRAGGLHALGAGTHALLPAAAVSAVTRDDAVGSFAHFCERRLAFELSSHRNPEQAIAALIHRVVDMAERSESTGYISCKQLGDALRSVGIHLEPKEIEVIATGFASDAKGGVLASEFCEVVKVLLFNLVGEHAVRAAEQRALSEQEQGEVSAQEALVRLLNEICEAMIARDRKGVIATSDNLFKTLLRPFLEYDSNDSAGVVRLDDFARALVDTGAENLVKRDFELLVRAYAVDDHKSFPLEVEEDPTLREISSFREKAFSGSLQGATAVNPAFRTWLAGSSIGNTSVQRFLHGENIAMKYPDFARHLAEVMEDLLQRKGASGGLLLSRFSRYPWVLKEFELVDALIVQLEAVKPSQRRRLLMSLQYALAAADPLKEGKLDGFTVLNALLNCGFRLQRVNRVRLLRAVEEMGGKMDYRELVQILLNSFADWSAEEKTVVARILTAMGVTVLERRAWLARLRQALQEANARTERRTGRWFVDGGAEPSSSYFSSTMSPDRKGIPPAAFLHCLRECGVNLKVEEEATLLDCLDTERLARLGRVNIEYTHGWGRRAGATDTAESGVDDSVGIALGLGGTSSLKAPSLRENWSIPLVEYESFVNFCARHCGSWYDAAPEVNASLCESIGTLADPVLAVHEFAALLASFDEGVASSGQISRRAFEVCCHRARLVANMPEVDIAALADVLVADGGGRVKYPDFLVHVRAMCAMLAQQKQRRKNGPEISIAGLDSNSSYYGDAGVASAVPGIVEQLIQNATDGSHTLSPLRKWLVRNTDMETCLLTPRDLSALLREFSVIYRPEDFEDLQSSIGRHMEVTAHTMHRFQDMSALAGSVFESDGRGGVRGERENRSGGGSGITRYVLDSRDLLQYLLSKREHWTTAHVEVAERMRRSMRQVGLRAKGGPAIAVGGGRSGMHSHRPLTATANGLYERDEEEAHGSYVDDLRERDGKEHGVVGVNRSYRLSGDYASGAIGARGVETAVARKILSRMRAFAVHPHDAPFFGAATMHYPLHQQQQEVQQELVDREGNVMLEVDIFAHLMRLSGVALCDEDIFKLADATDCNPEAARVRVDVILEALNGARTAESVRGAAGGYVYGYGHAGAIGAEEDASLTLSRRRRAAQESGELTEAGVFALEHLRGLLWATASRLHRTAVQWNADVRTVVRGFDQGTIVDCVGGSGGAARDVPGAESQNRKLSGFISSEDFYLALRLLNCSVSPDILRDIHYVPEGPGLIPYEAILDHVLVPPSTEHTTRLQHRGNGGEGREQGDPGESARKTFLVSTDRGNNSRSNSAARVRSRDSPVRMLINVIRRSLNEFIVSDKSLEDAWVQLLKVFQRFDPQQSNAVTPRDFCLAVSVLIDGDDIILTKDEWAEIFDFFSVDKINASSSSSAGASSSRGKARTRAKASVLGGAVIDYMTFCDMVLDPKDMANRIRELRRLEPPNNVHRPRSLSRSLSPTRSMHSRNSAADHDQDYLTSDSHRDGYRNSNRSLDGGASRSSFPSRVGSSSYRSSASGSLVGSRSPTNRRLNATAPARSTGSLSPDRWRTTGAAKSDFVGTESGRRARKEAAENAARERSEAEGRERRSWEDGVSGQAIGWKLNRGRRGELEDGNGGEEGRGLSGSPSRERKLRDVLRDRANEEKARSIVQRQESIAMRSRQGSARRSMQRYGLPIEDDTRSATRPLSARSSNNSSNNSSRGGAGSGVGFGSRLVHTTTLNDFVPRASAGRTAGNSRRGGDRSREKANSSTWSAGAGTTGGFPQDLLLSSGSGKQRTVHFPDELLLGAADQGNGNSWGSGSGAGGGGADGRDGEAANPARERQYLSHMAAKERAQQRGDMGRAGARAGVGAGARQGSSGRSYGSNASSREVNAASSHRLSRSQPDW